MQNFPQGEPNSILAGDLKAGDASTSPVFLLYTRTHNIIGRIFIYLQSGVCIL